MLPDNHARRTDRPASRPLLQGKNQARAAADADRRPTNEGPCHGYRNLRRSPARMLICPVGIRILRRALRPQATLPRQQPALDPPPRPAPARGLPHRTRTRSRPASLASGLLTWPDNRGTPVPPDRCRSSQGQERQRKGQIPPATSSAPQQSAKRTQGPHVPARQRLPHRRLCPRSQ
jgi:hypothetical protein